MSTTVQLNGPTTELEARIESGDDALEVSIVMPCLNEAKTVGRCIEKARRAMDENGICGEIVVADNASNDDSRGIALRAGARVTVVDCKGYGSALLGGIHAARGQYIVIGDADDSYDFEQLPRFVEKLREGFELVVGNRFRGGVLPGAMPALHRYFGNPVLSGIGRLLFNSPCGDFHCGMRGFNKRSIDNLCLRSQGMEFASEMIVKATIHRLKICEVPTTLSPDGRNRPSHLRSWRDGWRHLRFMLLLSPRWLFLYPGLFLMIVGMIGMGVLLRGPQSIATVTFDVHTLLFAGAAILVGFQAVLFALLGKMFTMQVGLTPLTDSWRKVYRWMTLETGLVVGGTIFLLGLIAAIVAVGWWKTQSFGPLPPERGLRLVIPSVVMLVLGCQLMLGSFFFSVLGLIRDERTP